MRGFQLWANLPRTQKMTRPKYRDVREDDIPVVKTDDVTAKIIAGAYRGVRGPVQDVIIDPEYLDIELRTGARLSHEIPEQHTVFAYVFKGNVVFGEETQRVVEQGTLVVFKDGESVVAHGGGGGRFLLISGRPMREPIAWYGPIVMNTREELDLAFKEFRAGTFVKHQ